MPHSYILRLADHIFIEELHAHDLYEKVSQAFTVFLPVKSVGVTGDGRRCQYVVSLRAVLLMKSPVFHELRMTFRRSHQQQLSGNDSGSSIGWNQKALKYTKASVIAGFFVCIYFCTRCQMPTTMLTREWDDLMSCL